MQDIVKWKICNLNILKSSANYLEKRDPAQKVVQYFTN